MPCGDDRIPVLLNPAAGRRPAAAVGQLEATLAATGIRADVRVYAADELPAAVAALRDAGAPVVAVGGGDGTVRAAAEQLAGGQTALAILPTGTLNHFARRLGIGDIASATAALADGSPMRVPIGAVEDRVFLNTATFGQYAAVVRERERLRRWIGKWPAAGVAFARALRRLHPIGLSLDMPDGRLERVSPLLWVGIGRATFPRSTRGESPPDIDSLEVVIARVRTRRAGLAFLARLFIRALRERPSTDDAAIETLHTRGLTLREPSIIEATLDGELFTFAAPVDIRIAVAALLVVVPHRVEAAAERR